MKLTQLESDIFLTSEQRFEETALKVFDVQSEKCLVYREFLQRLNRPKPKSVEEIPFLPISFFKSHEIIHQGMTAESLFLSSGTGKQQRSKHFVASNALYERSFLQSYERFAGTCEEQIILALLPNYLEQGNSSLVYMVDYLIRQSKNSLSGFYKDDLVSLLNAYELGKKSGKKLVIFGVSYALLDLAKLKPDLSEALVIETGGMKGRRKEMTKEELHETLKNAFGLSFISSEYGMTELLSQAYSDRNGYFSLPPWMKVFLRDTNDPLSLISSRKTGGINVVDLANLYSCSFIATQDLGQLSPEGLKLMGRFDHSDIRGCNLLVE